VTKLTGRTSRSVAPFFLRHQPFDDHIRKTPKTAFIVE
jgi:hypothetical protein